MLGAHRAPPFDRYLAGFSDGAGVVLHKFDPATGNLLAHCDSAVASMLDVDIAAIQALQGVRSPGPDSAQKHFNLVFVAESNGRLLTPVELTFYETLAAHFMSEVPAGDPDPYLGFNWPSATRFWGAGVTWDGRDARGRVVAAGTYFVSLRSRAGTVTRKVLLLR